MRWIAAMCAVVLLAGCGEDKPAGAKGSSEATGDGGVVPAEASAVPTHPSFHIERLDQVRFIVDTSVFTKLAIDVGARTIHVKKTAAGYRIKGIKAGSLMSRLGILDGDILVSVNDVSVAALDDVDRAFAAARAASRLDATLLRNAVTVKRRYVFRDSLYTDEDFSPLKASRRSSYSTPPAKREFDQLISVMEKGVQKKGPTELHVDRKIIDAIASRDDLFRYGADSYIRKGRGLHVTSTESIYGVLGLSGYDTVKMIDDEDVRSRYSFTSQIRSRQASEEIRFSVVRLHEPLVVKLRIVDGLLKDDAVATAVATWEQAAGLGGIPGSGGPYGSLGTGGASPNPYPPSPLPASPATVPTKSAADLAAYVTKQGTNRYRIDHKLIDAALSEPALFAKARVVPRPSQDGFKLFAIRPGSILATLGFQNGDVVHALNGSKLGTPDEVLYAWGKVKDAKTLRVRITRRGKKVTLRYRVKP